MGVVVWHVAQGCCTEVCVAYGCCTGGGIAQRVLHGGLGVACGDVVGMTWSMIA